MGTGAFVQHVGDKRCHAGARAVQSRATRKDGEDVYQRELSLLDDLDHDAVGQPTGANFGNNETGRPSHRRRSASNERLRPCGTGQKGDDQSGKDRRVAQPEPA